MLLALLVWLVGQAPTPVDAFRANFAAIRANLDYEYTFGLVPVPEFDFAPLQAGRPVRFAEVRGRTVIGRWECDGTTERYLCGSPPDVVQERRKEMEAGIIRLFLEPQEALSDGQTVAWHVLEYPDEGLRVFQTDDPSLLRFAAGPFSWFESPRFPVNLRTAFPNARPQVHKGNWGGHPVDWEIYTRRPAPDFEDRYEVAYDPALGSEPRFVRTMTLGPKPITIVKEMWLISCEPCAAGGFVPREYVETYYIIHDFQTHYPHYQFGDPIRPNGKQVTVRRFKVTRFENGNPVPRMEKAQKVRFIQTPAERFLLRQSMPLTLPNLKSQLESGRVEPSARALPARDAAGVRARLDESRPWPLNQLRRTRQASRADCAAFRRHREPHPARLPHGHFPWLSRRWTSWRPQSSAAPSAQGHHGHFPQAVSRKHLETHAISRT